MANAIATTPTTRPAARLAAGRAPTFDDVLARYQDEIYRYAAHLTRNRADADDLYQETLLRAYRAFGRLDGAANHRAWLYRIATNSFLSDRRKRSREHALDGSEVRSPPPGTTTPPASTPATCCRRWSRSSPRCRSSSDWR